MMNIVEQGGEGDGGGGDGLLLSQVTLSSITIVTEMGNAGGSEECSQVVERVQNQEVLQI